jgi:hypothetical protein
MPNKWRSEAVPTSSSHNVTKLNKVINVTKAINVGLSLGQSKGLSSKWDHKPTPVVQAIIVSMSNSMSFTPRVVEVLGVDAVRRVS